MPSDVETLLARRCGVQIHSNLATISVVELDRNLPLKRIAISVNTIVDAINLLFAPRSKEKSVLWVT